MTDLESINQQISALKERLDKAQGPKCEVYTRIVGYYRQVGNWNIGKRAEYDKRSMYSPVIPEK